jgi:hypothetical protein
MERLIDELLDVTKKQAELFLIDAAEFYPFGTCINKENEVVPIGANLETEHPSSIEVIDLLENAFKKGLNKGDYLLTALAIDVSIKENSESINAIEIRFFEANKDVYKKYFKYVVKDSLVEFFPLI